MNTEEMTDQEKSAMLARVMGWGVEHNEIGTYRDTTSYRSWLCDNKGHPIVFPCGDDTIERRRGSG